MMNRGAPAPVAVQVDALSYWEKREASLSSTGRVPAIETGEGHRQARSAWNQWTPRCVGLIHRTFAANPDVTTGSEGEGAWRKIVIRSRKG